MILYSALLQHQGSWRFVLNKEDKGCGQGGDIHESRQYIQRFFFCIADDTSLMRASFLRIHFFLFASNTSIMKFIFQSTLLMIVSCTRILGAQISITRNFDTHFRRITWKTLDMYTTTQATARFYSLVRPGIARWLTWASPRTLSGERKAKSRN